jgi:hypothetical protein
MLDPRCYLKNMGLYDPPSLRPQARRGSPRRGFGHLHAQWVCAIALFSLTLAIGLGLRLGWREGAAESNPTLFVFTSPRAPLTEALRETLATTAVARLVTAHFSLRRVDAGVEAALFRRFIGASGQLGSAVVDVEDGAEDVVGVLPGYADAGRYAEFLQDIARHLPRLRKLRRDARQSVKARLELADIYSHQGSAERARACLEGIAGPADLLSQALEHLARLDVQAGRTIQARAELERARALGGPKPPPRWLLTEAMLLSAERRVSAAAASLTPGVLQLATGPERAHAFLLLGQMEHELGHDAQALLALQTARAEARADATLQATLDLVEHIEHPSHGHDHAH